ncbi:hypothetical protein [Lactococcus hircilactis]|nr:hypothetical protein [Lactococcus hircilactis]
MKEIINACHYVAGVHSRGMKQIKEEFEELTAEQIKQRDSLNLDFLRHAKRPRTNKSGIRFDGEKEGGEINLFDEVAK